MNRCTRCYMPDTRPGSVFVDGVCGACRNYDKRAEIDWEARWEELRAICDLYRGRNYGHDCVIPVSGGKDSFTLVKVMVEDMGMTPLLVTVGDPFTHTRAGLHNLSVLQEKHDHWHYRIGGELFRRATRIAFEETGEALRFVETAIYTIPFMLAQQEQIGLVVFGEDSAYEYGSSDVETPDAARLILEMGGQVWRNRLWWQQRGLTEDEVASICPKRLSNPPQVIFLSHYMPWSSVSNLAIAQERGFWSLDDTQEWERQGTIEQFEQIDSVAYMVHLWLKYPKFGFQRAMDIASRRCREGLMTLEEVKEVAENVDPLLDAWALDDFCRVLGYTMDEFRSVLRKFVNKEVT